VCKKVGLSEDDTQSLISKIGEQEIKDQLKETTQKALDMGVSCTEYLVDRYQATELLCGGTF